MYCLIKQANSLIIEIRVDPKSPGQECLEQVCKHLGISNEADYFGLKYENSKGEELWLNLRNPIDRQCHHGHTSPLRLTLRVKFWVPPHLLLQETTRHQFYLDAKLNLYEKNLLAPDWDCVARLIALIAQTENGDYNQLYPPHNIYMQASVITSILEQHGEQKPNDLLQKIINEHKKLKGMRQSSTEYWLLKEISTFKHFGEETFIAKLQNNLIIKVGPHGIKIYENNKNKQLISFTNIISASNSKRTFRLEYLSTTTTIQDDDDDDDDVNNNNKETQLVIKLDSIHMASSLYRAITEKHAFYSCETVRSAVTRQFIRDLKGTIVSIFNEDSQLGKKYVFDIKRTCREVYDNARRAIYQENRMQMLPDCVKSGYDNNGNQCEDSNERLAKLLDAMTCKICMDNQIDAVFLPCAHVVACTTCADKCERCPVCRSDITQAQKLFLPGEFKQPIC